MRVSLRRILFALGGIVLVTSLPWQIAWAIIDASRTHLHAYSYASALMRLLPDFPQILFDMVTGGVLMMLCRIDEKLESRA